jgi:hypothetical protein
MLFVSRALIDEVLYWALLDHNGISHEQIRNELRKHKLVFLYLTGSSDARSAYRRIREALKRNEDPGRLVPGPPSDKQELITELFGLESLPPGQGYNLFQRWHPRPLPEWLREELKVTLRMRSIIRFIANTPSG